MTPETKYTRVDNINIAYQVVGNGPVDLILVPGWVSNIEVFWEEPRVARFFNKLATFSRLILFDKRGTGLSDRITEAATLEERIDDVRAVLDAIGSQRAALVGYSEGGPMCALFGWFFTRLEIVSSPSSLVGIWQLVFRRQNSLKSIQLTMFRSSTNRTTTFTTSRAFSWALRRLYR
jgi:alpha/beta hydrolase family protein